MLWPIDPVGDDEPVPERAADDLFAKKLSAEGPDTEDVRDRVRIPALRQHRNGDDTPNAFT